MDRVILAFAAFVFVAAAGNYNCFDCLRLQWAVMGVVGKPPPFSHDFKLAVYILYTFFKQPLFQISFKVEGRGIRQIVGGWETIDPTSDEAKKVANEALDLMPHVIIELMADDSYYIEGGAPTFAEVQVRFYE